MLREGRQTGDAMVNLVTASPDVPTARALADRLRARCPHVTSVVLNVNPKKAAVAVGVEEHPIAGNETIRERLRDLVFSISANSFFQTNTRQAERLFGIVGEYAGLTGQETVLDLYAGTGAISLLLARQARAVYGIELVPAAIEDAARNARANGITNCTFLPGEVRHVLPDLLARGVRADVVVADPPRAGFHPKALRSLATLAARRIVYVSCNPATLARDLATLCAAGYRITAVQPVDMFPHTPHIEVVVRLERPGVSGRAAGRLPPCGPVRRRRSGSAGRVRPRGPAAPARPEPGPPRRGRGPSAATPASAAERPSATSRMTPRTLSPARSRHPPGGAAERPVRAPGLRPGREAEQRAERVDGHVAHGGHAARVEPLPELVQPAVGRREDEGRRRPRAATGRGRGTRGPRGRRTRRRARPCGARSGRRRGGAALAHGARAPSSVRTSTGRSGRPTGGSRSRAR